MIISIKDLKYRYPVGNFHLHVSDLEITHGEKVAVIGPSGSGKTTLLNLVAGILTPQAGKVTIETDTVSTLSDAARRDFRVKNIGYIFQDFGLIDYLYVIDNILHSYRITNALKIDAEVRGRARWLAEQMNIGDKLKRHPSDLSHGERQRVAICRALLPGPKLILADEATGNLDPENKIHILELLFKVATDHEATLLAVTHDQELLKYFDRVVNFLDFRV